MNINENKELVRRHVNAIWNDHKIERLSEFVRKELLEESQEHTRQFLTAFPDVQVDIQDMIAEGDKVVVRLSASATNTGPFAGKPATGKKVHISSIRIFRLAEGKIAETWAMQDRLGLMEQLGINQSSGNVNWAAGQDD
jgi:steroid delta-isomerase-like uncharacterized protein